MTTAMIGHPEVQTLEELVDRLGSVPLHRIASYPPPGTAAEEDIFTRPGGQKRLYELVDGVLVEKPMGYYESLLAATLIRLLGKFLDEHDLGILLGADATLRLLPGLVRLPDVSFLSWDHFPGRILPAVAVPDLVPDLAVEILSDSNTPMEMDRKLQEYFKAGVRLVWFVYPRTQSVTVYTSSQEFTELNANDILDGGPVLPGFQLPVREWFQRAGHQQTR